MRLGTWLLSEQAVKSGVLEVTPDQLDGQAAAAFFSAREVDAEGPGFLIANGVAVIPIVGVLTKTPDFIFSLIGGGSAVYPIIAAAVRAADADEDVESIELVIDSAGGSIAGMLETAEAIAGTSKPIVAKVNDLAASAAFALAAAADSIELNNRMALVGSIGIVVSQRTDDGVVHVSSTAAPKKAPDLATQEGRDAILEELDAMHAEFAALIAKGRGTTVADVNENFGQGGLLIASEALTRGMVDGIGGETPSAGISAATTTSSETATMTREELQAKHPEVYAALLKSGHEDGVAAERDRVTAHVNAGEACGDLSLSAKFIADGSRMSSDTVAGAYLMANRKSVDKSDSAADSGDGGNADGKASAKTPATGAGGEDADALKLKAGEAFYNGIFDELERNSGLGAHANRATRGTI